MTPSAKWGLAAPQAQPPPAARPAWPNGWLGCPNHLRRPYGRLAGECRRRGGEEAWISRLPPMSRPPKAASRQRREVLTIGVRRGGAAPQLKRDLPTRQSPWAGLPDFSSTTLGQSGSPNTLAALVWGGSAPPGNAVVKGKGAPLGAPAFGALDNRGGHGAHAIHPPHRPHSRPGRPRGRRRRA
jgi:hypothetical protein